MALFGFARGKLSFLAQKLKVSEKLRFCSANLQTAVNLTFYFKNVKGDQPIVLLPKATLILPAGQNATIWEEIKVKTLAIGHNLIVVANCTNLNDSGPCGLR